MACGLGWAACSREVLGRTYTVRLRRPHPNWVGFWGRCWATPCSPSWCRCWWVGWCCCAGSTSGLAGATRRTVRKAGWPIAPCPERGDGTYCTYMPRWRGCGGGAGASVGCPGKRWETIPRWPPTAIKTFRDNYPGLPRPPGRRRITLASYLPAWCKRPGAVWPDSKRP